MMNFVLKTRNVVLKTRNFVFKMMILQVLWKASTIEMAVVRHLELQNKWLFFNEQNHHLQG